MTRSLMELDINEAGLDDNGTTIKTKQGDQVLAINAKERECCLYA